MSTSVNSPAIDACRTALDQQAQGLDELVTGPVPAIGGNVFGDSGDAVALANSVRSFDSTVFGQLARAAGLIHAVGAALGGGAEMFQELDRLNGLSVGRYESA